MIYYVVFDTNVAVSSFLKKGSVPDKLIQMALNGPIVPLYNEKILAEYREVLGRPKFRLNPLATEELLVKFQKYGALLEATPSGEQFVDKDDVVFYEVALTAMKLDDAYLVTGNQRHFSHRYFIVTPRQMLDIILGDHDA